jgi:putative membrane protein
MKRASKLFSEDDRKRIGQAVADAEAKTSAEIVPAVVTASGRYDRAEDIVGLWVGLIAVSVVWALFQDVWEGDWGETVLAVSLPIVLGLIASGWLLGVLIADQFGWLRRLFTPRKQMKEEVEQAARRAFYDSRVHHTKGSTGVLIYVSLFEHVAVVLADQTVTEKLGQEKLDAFCHDLTAELRQRKYTDAFCNTISKVGIALAEVAPRQDGDHNELADALVVMD